MMATLGDLAKLVRSKNAGPFWLTIDVMFGDAAAYRRARDAEIVNRAAIARLYSRNPAEIIGCGASFCMHGGTRFVRAGRRRCASGDDRARGEWRWQPRRPRRRARAS